MEEEGDPSGEEDEEPEKKGRSDPRNRFSIYQKMQAIREMDRLIESGQTTGIEKAVMKTFPAIFCGLKGNKSGMLGRWKTQCDKQRWREIPFEKLSVADRQMKELPDWVRIPLGLVPRNLERFREGGQVPVCIVNQLVDLVEKLTTGCNSAALTTGTLNSKQIQKEAERLLKIYNKAQEEAAEAAGKPVPLAKTKISDRWANRLLVNYGWKRHAPNTYGAYLAYDDERMVKSRKMFGFRRWVGSYMGVVFNLFFPNEGLKTG